VANSKIDRIARDEGEGVNDGLHGRPSACEPGEIHVWRVAFHDGSPVLEVLDAVLSDDERARAARLATEELRCRWTAARCALRVILAGYAGASPASLVLATDANQKPRLSGLAPSIFFNVTHTGAVAFIAVGTQELLGIDAEMQRVDIDWEGISERFFVRAEAEEIASLAAQMRVHAFYACWTRKEAYLKALGVGLNMPLDRFQVSARPDAPPRLLWVDGLPEEPAHWSLQDLSEPGVTVTLAARMPEPVVRRFSFAVPRVCAEFG
jgi:4'-phosphopantetheinyl transferase